MLRAGKRQDPLSPITLRLCIGLVLIWGSDLRRSAVRAGLTRASAGDSGAASKRTSLAGLPDTGVVAIPAHTSTSARPRLERWKRSQVVALDSIGDGFEIFDPIRPDLDENGLSHVVVTIRIVGQRDDTVAGRTHDINHPEPCNLNGGANLPTRVPAGDDPTILNGIDVRRLDIQSNSRNSVARHSAVRPRIELAREV